MCGGFARAWVVVGDGGRPAIAIDVGVWHTATRCGPIWKEQVSLLEIVLKSSTKVESLLRELGGRGNGLNSLLSNLSHSLSQDLKDRIKRIAEVRNSFAHNHEFQYRGDEHSFLLLIQGVINDLAEIVHKNRHTPYSPLGGIKTMSIVNSDEWILENCTSGFNGKTYNSSQEKRLVIWLGSSAKVIPPKSQYRVPLVFSSVSALDLIRMTPGNIEFFFHEGITSKDGISLRAKMGLQVRIKDKDETIKRIALDCESEKKSLYNHIFLCSLNVFSAWNFEEKSQSQAILSGEILKESFRSTSAELSFDIMNLSIYKIESGDPFLDGIPMLTVSNKLKMQSVIAKRANEINEVEHTHQIKQKEYAMKLLLDELGAINDVRIRRVIANCELEIEGLRKNQDLEIAKNKAEIASSEGGLFGLDTERAFRLEELRIENQKYIEQAKMELDQEVIRWAAQGAMSEGELNAFRQYIKNIKFSFI